MQSPPVSTNGCISKWSSLKKISQKDLIITLMKSKETAVINALCKYIHTAFKMREEHMSLL